MGPEPSGRLKTSRLCEAPAAEPPPKIAALGELVRRLRQELRNPFGAAEPKVKQDTLAALRELHTELLAEERKKAATDDAPVSLVRAGRPAGPSTGKVKKSSKLL